MLILAKNSLIDPGHGRQAKFPPFWPWSAFLRAIFRLSVCHRWSPLASANIPTPFMVRCSIQRHPPRPLTPPPEPPSVRRKLPRG